MDRPLDRLDGIVLDALRLGAQQLLRTRIPAHAAVGATVELVRSRAGSKPTGFVNAVLRRVGERDEAAWLEQLAPDATEDPVGHLALVHAHPRWIAEVFRDALGPAADAELGPALAADDARPEVHLAARPGEITAEELAAVTGGDEAPYSPYGVHLTEGGDPGDLEPVREGLAVVQDEGSQLVALAAARAGLEGRDELWLDLCAGPGGKAVMLGALAAIEGATVDAVDRAPHRAALVEKASAGLPVRVHIGDAREIALPEAAYDRVLVDAPCTGLGALRRRPEARWRRRPEDVAELAACSAACSRHALERCARAASSPTRPARRTRPRPSRWSARSWPRPAPRSSTPRRCSRGPRRGRPRRSRRPALAAPPRHRRDVLRGPAPSASERSPIGQNEPACPPHSSRPASCPRTSPGWPTRPLPSRAPTGCTSTSWTPTSCPT